MKSNSIYLTEGSIKVIHYDASDIDRSDIDPIDRNVIEEVYNNSNFKGVIHFIDNIEVADGFSYEELLSSFVNEYCEEGVFFTKKKKNNNFCNIIDNTTYYQHICEICYFMSLYNEYDSLGEKYIIFLHGNSDGHSIVDEVPSFKWNV